MTSIQFHIEKKTTTALAFFLAFLFSFALCSNDSLAKNTRETASAKSSGDAKTDASKDPTASYANKNITADEAYRILVSGNARHIGAGTNAADDVQRPPADTNQYPIATIVYSPDMKTSPAELTETTERNVYLSQTKHSAVSGDDLASVEYGLMNLQTPLLVVTSHYPSPNVAAIVEKYEKLKAGAQKEVDEAVKKNFTGSKRRTSATAKEYNLVGPAIARVKKAYPQFKGKQFSRVVSETLAWQSLETILMKSTVTRSLIRSGRLLAVAAIVDDASGRIYWLGEHPLQEEFLKEAPKTSATTGKTASKTSKKAVGVEKLTRPVSKETVNRNLKRSRQNAYCNKVVYKYYNQPNYYVPSWRIFEPSVWVYCPWNGVCVKTFVPWPYWNPWGYPVGVGGVSFVYTTSGVSLFIGYNGYAGAYIPWNPHFRPTFVWWRAPCFLNCRRWNIAIYNSIYIGAAIVYVPYVVRPWWDPYDPGDPWGPWGPWDPKWEWDITKPVGPVYPDPEEEWDITKPTDPIYPDPEEEEWDIAKPVGPLTPDPEDEEWDIAKPVGPLTPDPEDEEWDIAKPTDPIYPDSKDEEWDITKPVGPIYPSAKDDDWKIDEPVGPIYPDLGRGSDWGGGGDWDSGGDWGGSDW